jgi:hypothetical protein
MYLRTCLYLLVALTYFLDGLAAEGCWRKSITCKQTRLAILYMFIAFTEMF